MKASRIFRRLCCWLLVSNIIAVQELAAQSNTILYSDFEGPNISLGWDGMETCCSYSMTTSTTYKRTGKQSLRLELRKTDTEIYGNKRAELADNSYPIPHETNRRWWGFSTFFPPDFQKDSVHEIFAQWHYRATSSNISASPPLSLQVYKGDWILEIRYDSVDINTDKGSNIKLVSINLGPWTKSAWTDWVFNYNYSPNDDGSLKVWKNGQLVVDYKGKCYYKGSYDPFFKIGIYRWVWGATWPSVLEQSVLNTRVYYVDNVRIGNKQSILQDFLLPASLPTNVTPVATAGDDQSMPVPYYTATLKSTGTFDPDGTIAGYQWNQESGPNIPTLADPKAADLKISGMKQGSYRFRLTVTDNQGAKSSSTAEVTVTGTAAINQPPIAFAGNTKILTLPTNAVTLSGTGSTDPDGQIASYTWSQESGPYTAQILNPKSGSTTVSALQKGSYYFKLVVADNSGAIATDYVQVYVDGVAAMPNVAPVAAAGNAQTITLPVNSVTLSGSASYDSDGSISAYRWTQLSGPSTATLGNAATATATAGSLVAGTYVFSLQVTDNSGATDTAQVAAVVNPVPAGVNVPPVANAGTNQTFPYYYNTITLRGTGSYDPDGTVVAYQWSQDSGPAVLLSTPDSVSTLARNVTVSGTYVFRLRVTDNKGLTSSGTVTVVLTPAVDGVSGIPSPNTLPVARPGSNASYQNMYNTITLNGNQSTDSDGLIVKYKWVQESGPSIQLATPDSFYCLARNPQVATYVFRLIVTDNKGGVSSAPVTYNLLPVNVKPVANAGSSQTFQIMYTTITLNGGLSADSDGVISKYRWDKESGPSAGTSSTPDSVVNVVRGIAVGTYVFRLVVTDDDGAADTARVTINVLPITTTARVTGGTETIAAEPTAFRRSGDVWKWGQLQAVTYPNPVRNQLQLEMNSKDQGRVVVRLFDLHGALIWQDRFEKNGARVNRTLYLSGVPAGIYLLKVTQGDRSILSKQVSKLE
ncbi:PKD domain-containing protein [Flavihumibacter petaseus]|uniref:PKD/Chitinase domain-containing protein n=1 Tax=Flavihumibacter petaseus NBRC 106054 TaxID=1220578 RepID=A0A0E9N0E9_9BACT|nr:heparin lyase I family protein [Flavihumibacter petaseus]GAO43253.1 hypothetical protein FPE01S_02_03570 [Flavihumibacter petaseus NBRC 106054]